MDGKWLVCVVMALACCVRKVKSARVNGTVHLFATVQDTGLRQWRDRRADACRDIVHTFKGVYDMTAQLKVKSITPAGATAWCLANTMCTGYTVVSGKTVYYSKVKKQHITNSKSISHVVVFRCPVHHRCNKSPCKNGATCRDVSDSGPGIECVCDESWAGWYCERKESCIDQPCGAGETCSNSTTGGFTCTANSSADTKIAIAVAATWGVIVVIVACAAATSAARSAGARTQSTYVRTAAK